MGERTATVRTRAAAAAPDEDRVDAKRARGATPAQGARHFVAAFDRPFDYLEVSLPTLLDYDCRTARVVQKDTPATFTPDGHPVWRVPYTHSAARCWIRAINLGEIVLGNDVTMQEVLGLLQYEGINAPHDLLRLNAEQAAGAQLRNALWTSTHGTLRARVRGTAEAVADALVQWPRLARALHEAAGGGESSGFTCSPTRAWVRFAPRPRLRHEHDGRRDTLYQYCAQKPRPPAWLSRTLRLIGQLYCTLPHRQRTVSCFREIDALVQRHVPSWLTKEHGRLLSSADLSESRAFANAALQTTFAAGPRVGASASSRGRDAEEEVLFARACISLAEWVTDQQMVLDHFFSGACADDKGETEERLALTKALRTRRVRVVRWRDVERQAAEEPANVTPLVFPPGFVDDGADRGGACVLLSFEAYA